MKLTKKHLRQIIREEIERASRRPRGRSKTAEFDREFVVFPGGDFMEHEELAAQVSNESQWGDNFMRVAAFAAQALRDKYGVETVTDFENPDEEVPIDEFISNAHRIAKEDDQDDLDVNDDGMISTGELEDEIRDIKDDLDENRKASGQKSRRINRRTR